MPIGQRQAPHTALRSATRRVAKPTPSPRQRPLLFNFDPTLSSVERGRRQTQWVLLGTIVIVILIALVGGVGFYVNAIRRPSAPVAIVNGEPIRHDTWQHYQALLTAELQGRAIQLQSNPPAAGDSAAAAQQQTELSNLQQQMSGVGDQAANDLIDAQIIADAIPALEKAGAPPNQIVPTAAQVDTALSQEKKLIGTTTTAQYQQALGRLGLSEAQLRAILTTRLEQDSITTYLSKDLQTTQPQVKARIMTFGAPDKAAAALKALQGGQQWADVDAQYQKDAAAKETSREVDWTPKGVEDATFDQFAFSAQPFQISAVLNDAGNSEIIQVEDVAPARPLTATQISQIKTKTYSDWLNKQTANAQVQRLPQNMGQ